MRIVLIALIIFSVASLSLAQPGFRNSPSKRIYKLEFSTHFNDEIQFVYPDTINNQFLGQLRNENNLLELTKNCKTVLEKVLVVTNWANKQWKHNGNNEPSKSDALTILKEAKQGNKFRCVEYGIVLASALNSIGVKSRVLALKTKDVEIVKAGAGHVLAEAYLDDLKKWVMLDAQFNLVPVLNDVPLNAVEFQQTIVRQAKFKLIDKNGKVVGKRFKQYMGFIPQYLYFFDYAFDQRSVARDDKLTVNGKKKVMLVPLGAQNPSVFQINSKIDYCLYTNSIVDFYRVP